MGLPMDPNRSSTRQTKGTDVGQSPYLEIDGAGAWQIVAEKAQLCKETGMT